MLIPLVPSHSDTFNDLLDQPFVGVDLNLVTERETSRDVPKTRETQSSIKSW